MRYKKAHTIVYNVKWNVQECQKCKVEYTRKNACLISSISSQTFCILMVNSDFTFFIVFHYLHIVNDQSKYYILIVLLQIIS